MMNNRREAEQVAEMWETVHQVLLLLKPAAQAKVGKQSCL